MRAVSALCLLIVIATAEVTCLNIIAIDRVRPDLILVILVYLAVDHGLGPALGVAAVGGLMQDIFGMGMPGANVFSKVIVCMIIADAGTRVVVTERPAVRMTLIAVATLIHMTIMYCLLALAGFHYAPGFRIVRMIIPAMFYHALITPPAWWATRRYILWTDRWAPRGDI